MSRTGAALDGFGTLARLTIRRDRLLLPVWMLVAAAFPAGIAGSTAGLYPTARALADVAAEAMANPSQIAMRGPVFGANVGGLTAWTVGSSGAILVGLVSMLLVIRHTRVEEESGRRELVGAGVVGRPAPLTAALAVVLAANVVIAVLVAGLLAATGLPVAGSIALGLSLAAAGWTFAAVGAVTAQLTESAVAARGLGVAVFIVCFLVRAAGDAGGATWVSWLSPLGWTLRVRPFAGEQWWVLALPVVLVAVLAAVAYLLSARRDVAAGLVRPKPGPATAAPRLRSPLALAWRLHRGALAAWTAGFAVGGLVLGGAVSGSLAGQLDAPGITAMVTRLAGAGADPSAFFVNYLLSMLAWIVAAYGILAALRLRSEEAAGRADLVLATPAGRLRWAMGHLVMAVAGPSVAMLALGAATGLSYAVSTGDPGGLPRVLGSALAYLPAVWVMTGVAVLLAGLLPRVAVAAWGVWGALILLDVFGALGQVGGPVLTLIPFTHVPWVLLGRFSVTPLVLLAAVAAALAAAGLAGLRRRDLG